MNIGLSEIIKIAKIHAERIKFALSKIEYLLPISADQVMQLTGENLAYLELYTNRFAKLQDLIGGKIFTKLLENLDGVALVDKMTFIDKLNKLEKLEIIESAEKWRKMREIRNHISHEYPDMPDLTAKFLNETYSVTQELLNHLEKIIKFTKERL